MIPISVLTGFLGSGKTTLLGALLRHPQMERTAVIVNELGEIGIDHDLIATSDESFIELSNGCLCCNVRSDLVRTLLDLAARRRAGSLPRFDRVVIETSGLADPAPILHALMTDTAVRESYALAHVIATVDAVTGLETLGRFRESARQIALADCVVVTKSDLAAAQPRDIERAVRSIHPECALVNVVRGAISPAALFSFQRSAVPQPERWLLQTSDPLGAFEHRHSSGIGAVSVVRDTPVHAATLALFVSALAGNCGADLVRMKGIVAVEESRDRPAVLHGVQHVFHAPEWLPRWPSADRRSRIVCIGTHLSATWIGTLLDILEEEVAEETARRFANLARPPFGAEEPWRS